MVVSRRVSVRAGTCKYGSRCAFLHDVRVARVPMAMHAEAYVPPPGSDEELLWATLCCNLSLDAAAARGCSVSHQPPMVCALSSRRRLPIFAALAP